MAESFKSLKNRISALHPPEKMEILQNLGGNSTHNHAKRALNLFFILLVGATLFISKGSF